MSEEKEKRNLPFIQETVKQKRFYQIRAVQRLVWAAVSGGVFALAALAVFAAVWPKVKPEPEPAEVQPVTLPEPKEEEPEEPPVYIMEQVSIELEDYKKMYQQLMQIGGQAEIGRASCRERV